VLQLTVSESAFVVATVRAGEQCPDAIVSLWKDAGARRLELDRLSDEAVGILVESALGGPVDQTTLRWVCDASQGNALYVRELVLGAIADGTLTFERSLWRMSRRPSVSRSLAELVTRRMAGLSDEEAAPIELLALGEPLGVDEVAALSSYDSLVAAEAAGMVVVDPPARGGEVRLAHPLYGDIVRRDLPVLRARRLRLRLSETVQGRAPLTPDDALRVARWLLDAGERVPVALLVDAGRAAIRASDPDLGARLAELAVADRGGVAESILLARAHVLRGRFEDAEAVLAVVEDLDCTQDVALEQLELRVMRVLYWGLKRPEAAQAALVRAQMWWPDPAWQQRLYPLRLTLTALVEGFDRTVGVCDELLADPDLEPEVRRQLEPAYAAALFYTGRAREAAALAQRIRPRLPSRDRTDTLALGLACLIGVETGEDLREMDAWLTGALRDGVRANDDAAAGITALAMANLRILEGRYADAARWLAEAELHLERADELGDLVIARAQQVGITYLTADLEAVQPALARLHAALAGDEPRPSQRPYVVRAEARAALARGDAAGARRLLLDAADRLADMPGYASRLLYEALRGGAPPGPLAERQARLAERCDARLVAGYAAHTAARAAGDGTALLAACDELAAIGARRYAMEAALDAARAFLGAGREDSARRAATRARELHVPGQGTDVPTVDGLDAAATGLTTRESQLVALASRGMSNAEIAEQLVLSVRTVESHLYRAMHKLGVTDRHDL
jgi:DNA-binding CsgD family transcriptional regulator